MVFVGYGCDVSNNGNGCGWGDHNTDSTTDDSTEAAADNSTDDGTNDTADDGTNGSTDETSDEATNDTTDDGTTDSTDEATDNTTDDSSENDTEDSTDESDEDEINGNIFYVDPVNGNMANDGSSEKPFRTLQEVIENNLIETRSYTDLPYDGSNSFTVTNEGAPIAAGDTIILRNGHHGELNLKGAYNETPITIKVEDGHEATLSHVSMTSVSNWTLEGVTVTPEAADVYEANTLFNVVSNSYHGSSSNVTIKSCMLYSVIDSTSWSKSDWNDLSCNAINMSGDYMTAKDNYCLNVNFGITVSGDNGTVSGNTVENFAGDGMRGLGDDLLFENNLIKNCYDVNDNHDDGFQSWSINDDPPRQRVTLRGNTIINYEDPDQPFRGALQGIGCFDGDYIDWVVENNLVITDHWHGISFYGAYNCLIVNNTVVDTNDEEPGPPWIKINAHKDGTASENCVIRNNIASTISPSGDTVVDHNYLLQEEYEIFVDSSQNDYHLRPDATALIDTGSSTDAPDTDKDGNARPAGQGYDIGCYEQ
jgi:hypothetical protein